MITFTTFQVFCFVVFGVLLLCGLLRAAFVMGMQEQEYQSRKEARRADRSSDSDG